jgi:hypothetical protein
MIVFPINGPGILAFRIIGYHVSYLQLLSIISEGQEGMKVTILK